MPFQVGGVSLHDDYQHTGSAARDVVGGVAGLDSSGNLLSKAHVYLTRDVLQNYVEVKERTSGQAAVRITRSGSNDFTMGVMSSNFFSIVQLANMKDVVSGIAALGAGGQLLAPGSNIELTRDGSDNIEVVERTSGEIVYRWTRVGVDDYECRIHCGGVACLMLNDGMKDVADGIAGLDASGEVQNSVYAGLLDEYSLSAAVLHSHDASVNTVSTTYVKLKTITLSTLFQTPSTIRISFNLWTSNAAETAYGRIYKNGGAVGTERTRTGSGSQSFEEDISFAEGDTLELWLKSSSGSWNANANEFRVLGAETVLLLADAIGLGSVGLADPFVGANS